MSVFEVFKKQNNDSSAIKAEILHLAKNGVVMEVDRNRKSLQPDSSKIGGKPFLPADFVWPTFMDKGDNETRPLSFFCQLNLSELAPFDTEKQLPTQGMLSFFYECESFCCGFDPKDKGAARVFYFENTNDFVVLDTPKALDKYYIMPEMAVKFKTEKSYPMFEEFGIHSDMECDWDDYDNVLADLGVNTEEAAECHKVLGYADIIQGEILSECERTKRGLYCGDPESYQNTPEDVAADIEDKAKEWVLLLQLGTIAKGDFEWMFGDCGMLYYYIRKDDLAEKRFDNIWFSVQCF